MIQKNIPGGDPPVSQAYKCFFWEPHIIVMASYESYLQATFFKIA